MASPKKVSEVLAVLATNFAGDVTPERTKLWMAALGGVDDAVLDQGLASVLQSRTGDFFPPVGVMLQACAPPAPDPEALIAAIDRAGSYNPQTGWQAPRVDRVRDVFGDAAAEAYGAAGGGARLFAANETTREIAARDFAAALAGAVKAGVPLLPTLTPPKRLPHVTPEAS